MMGFVTARKEHKCWGCARPIAVGEVHRSSTQPPWKSDCSRDTFQQMRYHEDCYKREFHYYAEDHEMDLPPMSPAERKAKGLTLARKAHRCEACVSPIEPGELYVCFRWPPWRGEDQGHYGKWAFCRFCHGSGLATYQDDYTYLNEYYLHDMRRRWEAKAEEILGHEVEL